MKNLAISLAAVFAALAPAQAWAALPTGTQAPPFATQGAMGGEVVGINLASALRRGPVVLYFFPKAFTQGCTLETRAFAESIDSFKAAGATVIGLSSDDLPTLQRFSTEECRSKFAVAVASPAMIQAYDVALKLKGRPDGMSDRTSYVIGQDGRIAFVHTDLDYRDHVRLTLQAVQALKKGR